MKEHHSMTGSYQGSDLMQLPDNREEYLQIPMEEFCREIELFKRSNPGYSAMIRTGDIYFANHGRRFKPTHMFRAWMRAKAQVREELRQDQTVLVKLYGESTIKVLPHWIHDIESAIKAVKMRGGESGTLAGLQEILATFRSTY